jgi:hypothetical protein
VPRMWSALTVPSISFHGCGDGRGGEQQEHGVLRAEHDRPRHPCLPSFARVHNEGRPSPRRGVETGVLLVAETNMVPAHYSGETWQPDSSATLDQTTGSPCGGSP